MRERERKKEREEEGGVCAVRKKSSKRKRIKKDTNVKRRNGCLLRAGREVYNAAE